MEQGTRGDAGLDSFKGHLAPEIKATIIGSTMHTDVLYVRGGNIK